MLNSEYAGALREAEDIASLNLESIEVPPGLSIKEIAELASDDPRLGKAVYAEARKFSTKKGYCDKIRSFMATAEEAGTTLQVNDLGEKAWFEATCIKHVKVKGMAASTMEGLKAAIWFIHESAGVSPRDSWTKDEKTASFMRGIKAFSDRTRVAKARAKFSVEDLHGMLHCALAAGRRDLARGLYFLFFSMVRHSHMRKMLRGDFSFSSDGSFVEVWIWDSKTHSTIGGYWVRVPGFRKEVEAWFKEKKFDWQDQVFPDWSETEAVRFVQSYMDYFNPERKDLCLTDIHCFRYAGACFYKLMSVNLSLIRQQGGWSEDSNVLEKSYANERDPETRRQLEKETPVAPSPEEARKITDEARSRARRTVTREAQEGMALRRKAIAADQEKNPSDPCFFPVAMTGLAIHMGGLSNPELREVKCLFPEAAAPTVVNLDTVKRPDVRVEATPEVEPDATKPSEELEAELGKASLTLVIQALREVVGEGGTPWIRVVWKTSSVEGVWYARCDGSTEDGLKITYAYQEDEEGFITHLRGDDCCIAEMEASLPPDPEVDSEVQVVEVSYIGDLVSKLKALRNVTGTLEPCYDDLTSDVLEPTTPAGGAKRERDDADPATTVETILEIARGGPVLNLDEIRRACSSPSAVAPPKPSVLAGGGGGGADTRDPASIADRVESLLRNRRGTTASSAGYLGDDERKKENAPASLSSTRPPSLAELRAWL